MEQAIVALVVCVGATNIYNFMDGINGITAGYSLAVLVLHENIGQPHSKHVYQMMANELKMSHSLVTCIYVLAQLAVTLGFIYLCPSSVAAHWGYLVGALLALALVYVLFKKKYYHLHEEYLAGLKK